ncbi:MAG: hypothetical protein RLZZ519_3061 [Bacteroidota bacterium]
MITSFRCKMNLIRRKDGQPTKPFERCKRGAVESACNVKATIDHGTVDAVASRWYIGPNRPGIAERIEGIEGIACRSIVSRSHEQFGAVCSTCMNIPRYGHCCHRCPSIGQNIIRLCEADPCRRIASGNIHSTIDQSSSRLIPRCRGTCANAPSIGDDVINMDTVHQGTIPSRCQVNPAVECHCGATHTAGWQCSAGRPSIGGNVVNLIGGKPSTTVGTTHDIYFAAPSSDLRIGRWNRNRRQNRPCICTGRIDFIVGHCISRNRIQLAAFGNATQTPTCSWQGSIGRPLAKKLAIRREKPKQN